MCTSNVIEANYSKYGWIRNLEEEKEVFRKSCKKRKIASVLLCSISDLHANCIKAFPFECIRKKIRKKKQVCFAPSLCHLHLWELFLSFISLVKFVIMHLRSVRLNRLIGAPQVILNIWFNLPCKLFTFQVEIESLIL